MYYIQVKVGEIEGRNAPKHDKNYCCLRYFYHASNKEGERDTLELVEIPIITKHDPITVAVKIDRLRDAVYIMNINGKTIRTIPKIIG